MAREIARLDQHHPPELARLPVAVVAGVDAKAQEDRERDPHQRERRRGQRDLDVEELPVREHHRARQQQHEDLLREDARQQRTAADKEQVNPVRAGANDHDGQTREEAEEFLREEYEVEEEETEDE